MLVSSKIKADILSLLEIPPTRCRMVVKSLDHLIGNFLSMHLAVTGAIGNFYTIQVELTHAWAANLSTAYLLAQFHQDVHFWRDLCEVMDIRPTYLADIFHRYASDLR